MREQGLIPAQVRAFRPVTTVQGDFRRTPDPEYETHFNEHRPHRVLDQAAHCRRCPSSSMPTSRSLEKTDSVAYYTRIRKSHEMTRYSAPTGM
ncbi:hypothetical protein [Nonomuraea sp. NPDC049784]|uniref:hypothetical protein n=1 Tax=Nonomuraea sp. NPDC049784 TaxID=3154361 RepID=UPI0033CC927F